MKKQNLLILLFIIIVIFSTQFLRFAYWKQLTGGLDQNYYVLYPLIVLFAIPCISLVYKKNKYAKEIIALGVVSYLCIITIIAKGTGFSTKYDLPPILFSMAIFYYFPLSYYHVSKKSIINSVLVVGLFVFFIQVIQQLNPSLAIFGILNPEEAHLYGDIATMRNDLYRFILPTYQISLFCLFYSWVQLLVKRDIKSLLLFVCFAISVYLYLTRQIIFTSIIVLALTSFFGKNTNKRQSSWLPILFAIIIFCFSTALFGDFVEMTIEGGGSTEHRMESYQFFTAMIGENLFTFLFGCGTPKETLIWHEMGLSASDIGFVGEVFHKGIFALLIYLVILYKALIKYKRETPLFIRLYLICTFINSIMIFPYVSGHTYILWAILLYIADIKVSGSTTETRGNIRVVLKQRNH